MYSAGGSKGKEHPLTVSEGMTGHLLVAPVRHGGAAVPTPTPPSRIIITYTRVKLRAAFAKF